MGHTTGEEPPPKSTDLEGWRRAILTGDYLIYRLEDVVAAIQDLGPRADKAVLNPLAKHLSAALLYIIRGLVSTRHPNRGDDIVDRTHGQIINAMLRPTSADGKGLRVAFVPRVQFRVKDALAAEARDARHRAQHNPRATSWARGKESDHDLAETPDTPVCHDPAIAIAESIDVERILEQVPDDQKRLAFRLYMDGIPFKSKKTSSISETLGISERTARAWVHDVQNLLSTLPEVQDLRKLKAGGTP